MLLLSLKKIAVQSSLLGGDGYEDISPVDLNYECGLHGLCSHTLFGSYRVTPDQATMKTLVQALETAPSFASKSLTIFWDAQCLPIAWQGLGKGV